MLGTHQQFLSPNPGWFIAQQRVSCGQAAAAELRSAVVATVRPQQPSAFLSIRGGAKPLPEHPPPTPWLQCSFPLRRSWHLQLQLQTSGCWEKLRALPEAGYERCAQGEARGHSALPGCHGRHAPAQVSVNPAVLPGGLGTSLQGCDPFPPACSSFSVAFTAVSPSLLQNCRPKVLRCRPQ